MLSKRDLLLGRMAVEKRLITQAQLDECVREQQNGAADPPARPARPLGVVMLSKGFLLEKDLVALLEAQSERLQALENYKKLRKTEYLFGHLLVKNNYATMLQINKCLEIQLKMAEKGMKPVPRLGELLVEHGFVDKKTVAEVLKMQDKDVLFCTGCARQFNVVGVEDGKSYTCRECGGVMMRRALLDSLSCEDTSFGFDLPGSSK